jgi:hypothetical protein
MVQQTAKKKKKRRPPEEQRGSSLVRTYLLAFLVVNYMLWGIAAAIFNGGSGLEGTAPTVRVRSGFVMVIMSIVVFITSSFTTLPKIGPVMAYIWEHHQWYVLVVAGVNVALLLFIVWLRKVEHDLQSGKAFGKRRS